MLPIPILTEGQINNFWSQVDIQGPDDCWNWIGNYGFNRGYGRIGIKDKNYAVHRIAYFLHTKVDPINVRVVKICGNSACCNPAHLTVGCTGTKNPNSKLSELDVQQIRGLFRCGVSQRMLSHQFDVSRATIQDIINEKTWKNIRE